MHACTRHKPSVTLIMGRLPPSTGGEAYNYEVCQDLSSRGYRVHHVYVGKLMALTVVGLLPRVGPALASVVIALVLIWRRGLFIVDERFAGVAALANCLRRWLKRGKTVIVAHHLEPPPVASANALIAAWQRWRLAAADRVIAVSEATRHELIRHGVSPTSIRSVPPGFDPLKLDATPMARASNAPIRFLCVARCSPRKGLAVLLEAVSRLHGEAFHVDIVGDRSSAHYRRVLLPLYRALSLQGHVTFHGQLPQKTLASMYRSADAFVSPSRLEGFGIVLLEAMYCGLPIVATRAGAAVDLLEDGKNGVLVPAGDAAALADAMHQVASSVTLREKLGEEVRRRLASEGYRWQDTRAQFFEAIQDLLV